MTATPEQLHSALTYCIDFARTMLNKTGEFYPFGATVNPLGGVEAKAGWMGDDHPNPHELFVFLLKKLRAEIADGKAIGIAVAVNVNVPQEFPSPYPDGLRVSLEAEGYARLIYVPYRIRLEGILKDKRVTEFAEPFAVEIGSDR